MKYYYSVLLLLLVLLTININSRGVANASIHIYKNEIFKQVGNSLLLFGGSEAILISDSDSDSSFVRFEDVRFLRTKASANVHSQMEHNSGLIQVVMFEAADRNNIGGSLFGGQRSICCTPDLAKEEGCKQGEVLRIPSSTNIHWPFLINVQFTGNHLLTNMDNTQVNITKTGMYNLFFIACDPQLQGLTMSGKTFWKNPYGYLPARMAPLINFYLFMAFAYFLLTIVWFSQYMRFRDDILQLQHCISLVVALGFFEMILWYFDYANFNTSGTRPLVLTTWVVTVATVRKTVSRLLLLSVSMGYGVVRPTLGGITSKVLILGITYFLASELLNVTEYVGTINDISGRARLLLVMPNALLDAFFILWIFTSLSKTLDQLQLKRSSVKLEIYRKFSNALAIIVISSVAWIGYEVYFKATDPFNERWQSAWIITAFWDILTFALLCVICYLWAPSQNSQRYAYSEEVGEDDEETQSLRRGTPEGELSLVEMEKEKNANNDDFFDEEDGPIEEDKRE